MDYSVRKIPEMENFSDSESDTDSCVSDCSSCSHCSQCSSCLCESDEECWRLQQDKELCDSSISLQMRVSFPSQLSLVQDALGPLLERIDPMSAGVSIEKQDGATVQDVKELKIRDTSISKDGQSVECSSINLVFVLHENGRLPAHEAKDLLLAAPFKFHHKTELNNARQTTHCVARMDFSSLLPSLPLCAVSAIHSGTEKLRVQLLTRNFSKMIRFYERLLFKKASVFQPAFAIFPLGSKTSKVQMELTIKESRRMGPLLLPNCSLRVHSSSLQHCTSLLKDAHFDADLSVRHLTDPDGNKLAVSCDKKTKIPGTNAKGVLTPRVGPSFSHSSRAPHKQKLGIRDSDSSTDSNEQLGRPFQSRSDQGHTSPSLDCKSDVSSRDSGRGSFLDGDAILVDYASQRQQLATNFQANQPKGLILSPENLAVDFDDICSFSESDSDSSPVLNPTRVLRRLKIGKVSQSLGNDSILTVDSEATDHFQSDFEPQLFDGCFHRLPSGRPSSTPHWNTSHRHDNSVSQPLSQKAFARPGTAVGYDGAFSTNDVAIFCLPLPIKSDRYDYLEANV